ncbi:hepatic lectin-like [Haliotis rufescens]|uniref:hepatic lectin-like n=1 Tax=Haliotis rufescens TaxID=6454 RepID=UPI00201F0ECE|nr:hepatic lectin-like [Haliotis rufescens]
MTGAKSSVSGRQELRLEGLCFKFEADTLRSWRDAEIDCQSDHGHLVKLDSSAKNELIVKFAQELRLEVGKLVGFNIGAKDGDENGHWTWYDNTPVSSPKWGPNEPSGDGYCAQILSAHSYRWNDVNCSDSWGYICEIPM